MDQLNQLRLVWEEVLSIMAADLPERSFDAWLKDSRPVYLDGNTLYVEFPNEFTKDWVEARYFNPLTRTLRQVTNREWDLKFTIPEGVRSLGSPGAPAARQMPTNRNWSNRAPLSEQPAPADPPAPRSSVLNPRYTFENFVVGNSNRFAHAASLAVAETPAKAYNPLFIYGGVGLGKTHLMHAIAHFILANNKKAKVLYVTSEKFTNELINSIQTNKNVEFRNRYRNVDVLLIDDIQFIAGKESTQEEFFHTFNALHEANKQIIMSSDRPPKEIPTLEDRLRSRFEWGLITDIQPPDLETRIAILKKKATLENLEVDDEVLTFIAKRIESNIRELEGALTRIIAYSALTNNSLDVSVAEEALKDIISNQKQRKITPEHIQKIVADAHQLKVDDLKSKKRNRPISYPRQIAMYLCREMTDLSLPKIGDLFGGRDHTTVIHACDKIANDMESDPQVRKTVNSLIKRINES